MATAVTVGYIDIGSNVLRLSTGEPVVVFWRPTSHEICVYCWTGSEWNYTAQTATTAFGVDCEVSALGADVDSSDVIHIMASSQQANTNDHDVVYNTLTDAEGTPSWGTWQVVRNYLDPSLLNFSKGGLSLDSNGYPRVLWTEYYPYKGSDWRQPYYSHNVGSGWITAEKVATQEDDGFTYASLSVTPEDDVEAFYTGAFPATRRRNGSWGSEGDLGLGASCYGTTSQIVVDASGNVYRYSRVSTYVYENASQISGLATNNLPSQSIIAATINNGNIRVLLYRNGSDSGKLYGTYNEGAGWSTPEKISDDVPYHIVAGYSHNNDNYPAGTVGLAYQLSAGGTIYYEEYEFDYTPPSGVALQMDHLARLRRG